MLEQLSHLDRKGHAKMVDVTDKSSTQRLATAETWVLMKLTTADLIKQGGLPKGDVFTVARIAGIQGAKKTSDLIPLCHPVALTGVTIDFEIVCGTDLQDLDFLSTEYKEDMAVVRVTVSCRISAQTGVEMEALSGASIAALTIYDMCKAVDKGISIGPTRLLSKEGGKSGRWVRERSA